MTPKRRSGDSLSATVHGSQVRFLTAAARVSLLYGGLIATDTTGRRLPAELALREIAITRALGAMMYQ